MSYSMFINVLILVPAILASCVSSQKNETINDGLEDNKETLYEVTLKYENQKSLEKNTHESEKYENSHRNQNLLEDYNDKSNIISEKPLSNHNLYSFSKSQKLNYAKAHFERNDYKLTIKFLNSFLRELTEEGLESKELFYQKKFTKEATILLALSHIAEGDSQRALPLLENLTQFAPRWGYSYAVLAKYYFDMNAFILSKKVSQKGIELSTTPIKELYIFNAMSLSKLGCYDESSKILDEAQRNFTEAKGEFLSWQAVNLMFQNKYFEGCKILDDLTKINYMSTIVSYNKAYCLIRQKHWSDALSHIKASIKHYPEFSEFYFLKGLIKKNQGDVNAAKKYWSEYLGTSKISSSYKEILKISLNSILYD